MALVAVESLLLGPVAQAASPTTNAATSHSQQAHATFSLRLEDQLLAELHYLPVAFRAAQRAHPPTTTTTSTTTTSTTTTTSPTTTIPTGSTTTSSSTPTTTTAPSPTTTTTRKVVRRSPRLIPLVVVKGMFTWRFGSLPSAFRSQWSVGSDNVILRGAVMRFQSIYNLPTTGNTDTSTWQRLLTAARHHQYNPTTYNFVDVIKSSPERLQLYANGRIVFRALVNTGIAVMPTVNGTFPVYLRYTSQTMSGTNPDGTHYHDTGIPWVSYFNGGDALHGFIRASYGWPQSLGCVEMPFAQAKVLWPHTPLGTMVTVQS